MLYVYFHITQELSDECQFGPAFGDKSNSTCMCSSLDLDKALL